MYRLITLLIFLLAASTAEAQQIIIEDGRVWDGEAFTERDLYIDNGYFTDRKPSSVDTLIDARGLYIIPPFGDYHTHAFDSDFAITADSIFLAEGIFYSQDLVNDPQGRDQNRAFLNKKTTIDVAFANGAITSDFGHPIEGYERMALGVRWPRNKEERERIRNSRRMEGRYYYTVDDPDEAAEAVIQLLRTKPDVAKLILWNTKEYEESESYPVRNKGLDPQLLPLIVGQLAAAGVQPVAHIETEYDLKAAIDAGVQSFGHNPYYGYGVNGRIDEDYPRLSEPTKELLRSTESIVINPTLYRAIQMIPYMQEKSRPDEYELSLLKDFHRQMLSDLKESEVSIVAGADSPGINAIDEIMYYKDLDLFSDTELLNILINTGRHIFPDRKIGNLRSGYEGSLLILSSDPTENIEHIKNIELRIKQGTILEQINSHTSLKE